MEIEDKKFSVDFSRRGDTNEYSLILDGKSYHFTLEKEDRSDIIKFNGQVFSVKVEDERARLIRRYSKDDAKKAGDFRLNAPIPGLILQVQVETGESIRKSQGLVILEAMKMENEIKSPVDGVVKSIAVKEGDAIEKDTLMMLIESTY